MSAGLLEFVRKMKHSPLRNYAGIPGLTSWAIGGMGDPGVGMVRMMECSREHHENIIPHSHRFDLHCIVLAGSVRNVLWKPNVIGDEYSATSLRASGAGAYTVMAKGDDRTMKWQVTESRYEAGAEYHMTAKQVHSIYFSRGAVVLFFEGPKVSDESIILEPFIDGEVVPTFKVEPWMFKGDTGGAA